MILGTIIVILILLSITSKSDEGGVIMMKWLFLGVTLWVIAAIFVHVQVSIYVPVYYRQKLTMQTQNGKYANTQEYYFDSCSVRGNEIILYRNNSIYEHLYNPVNVHLYTADKNYGFEQGYYKPSSDKNFWFYPFN